MSKAKFITLWIILFIISICLGGTAGALLFPHSSEKVIILKPSPVPFTMVKSSNVNGVVTIIEFFDLQCPFSARNHLVLNELIRKNQANYKCFYLSYPLSIHEHAQSLAKAVIAADMQGKANELKSTIYRRQSLFTSTPDIEELTLLCAKECSLNVEKWAIDKNSEVVNLQLENEIQEGLRQKVSATPTTFINGYGVNGAQSLAVYEQIIEYLKNK
ncbi:MAG: DsbA family protein [Fibrobacteres bacterium]|nr:DsbA family protein [Fibrobacterota bacterium]